MKRMTALITLTLLILSLSACNRDLSDIKAEDLTKDVKIVEIDNYKDTTDTNTVAETGIILFDKSFKNENMLISPLSISYALSMTANGANGSTRAQFEKLLSSDTDSLNSYFASYMSNLSDTDDTSFTVANSIWFSDRFGFSPSQDFLSTCKSFYGADVFRSSFDRSTVKDINLWVDERTDGMIPHIVDDLDDSCIMLLLNAVSFDAEWEKVYNENQIHSDLFFPANKESFSTEYMYCTESVYLKDDDTTGFLKYYENRRFAFCALLPNEDITINDYISSLTAQKLTALLDSKRHISVMTMLPKFEYDYSCELINTLKDAGLTAPFDPSQCDLSRLGITNDANLYISSVLHKTHICVMEKGTRAGAATAVYIAPSSSSISDEDIKRVYLTRPFVYMIIDTETDTPIFIGALCSPE